MAVSFEFMEAVAAAARLALNRLRRSRRFIVRSPWRKMWIGIGPADSFGPAAARAERSASSDASDAADSRFFQVADVRIAEGALDHFDVEPKIIRKIIVKQTREEFDH